MSAPKRRKVVVETWRPGRYDCCHCRRDVRGDVHLRQLDEEKAELALCTDCYSIGRTNAGGAKWTADMVRVIDTAATGRPLLVEDWLADQEVRLLDGILQYGFGNWRAVAEHMGGDKTEQMCEEHYEAFYLRSKAFPLPDLSGPPKKVAPPPTKPEAAAHDAAAAGSSTVPKEKRGASGMIIDGNQVAPADLVGYMPLRGEYDTEWENEAELAICELEMAHSDPPEEYQRNLQLLFAYARQLDERQRRRDFVQAHDIIERAARHHQMDRRLQREERAFRTAMRPYAPHTTPDSHEALIKSALRETTLRRRAQHLRACVQAGIKSLPEADALFRQTQLEEESGHGKPSGPSSRSGGGAAAAGSHHAVSTGLGNDMGGGPGAGPQPPPPPAGGFFAPRPVPSAAKLALQAARAAKVPPANPGGVPPQTLLAPSESAACLSLGLAPSQYVECKRLLLRAACAKLGGPLSAAEAHAALTPKLDARRSQKLWLHFVKSGWIVGT